MAYEIPTEVDVPLYGVLQIHWGNHAALMLLVWFALVPLALLAIRFGKPAPTPNGIPRGTGKFDRRLLWWTAHYWGLYIAVGLTLAAGAFAVLMSGGMSGTLHMYFGFGTMLFAVLQIVSAWFRGSHGSMHAATADPNDPATWRGDHYDMTAQRRWFEAWHKTSGYFTVVFAFGATATGLAQYWLPLGAAAVAVAVLGALGLAVSLEGLGFRHDTYRSVYGSDPIHPGNRQRAGR